MSRIGKKPIDIPSGVKVTIADGAITVEGKDKLSMPPRCRTFFFCRHCRDKSIRPPFVKK